MSIGHRQCNMKSRYHWHILYHAFIIDINLWKIQILLNIQTELGTSELLVFCERVVLRLKDL